MAWWWLALGVVCAAAIACRPPDDPNYVDLGDPPGVIVPARDARKFYFERVHKDEGGFFTPRKSDVMKLQARLEGFLQQEQQRARKYYRQYVGIVVGGRRLIWGNFFCEEYEGWRRHGQVVFDGGYCYFGFLYDPETGQFSQFGHNGFA